MKAFKGEGWDHDDIARSRVHVTESYPTLHKVLLQLVKSLLFLLWSEGRLRPKCESLRHTLRVCVPEELVEFESH